MHSRRHPTVEIPLSRIVAPEGIKTSDPIVQLYLKLERGEIKSALTRLPISSIVSGYYEKRDIQAAHVSNLNQTHIPITGRVIRRGNRPTLDVLWSTFAPGGGGYVCADDEAALAAYSSLNFSWVPCRVLKPKKVDAAEASIWLEKRGKYIGLSKAVAPNVASYSSFVGDTNPPFEGIVNILKRACADTARAIVSFHDNEDAQVHYHQMLHALVRRHERILDSILRLIELKRIEHAEALTRLAYESFLNFYLDWLSPEFFGPRLQLLSAVRSAGAEEHQAVREEGLAVLSNFTDFIEKTSEKARISPLGTFFYKSIYPPLSLVVHQSYSYLDQEASCFETSAPIDDPIRIEQLGRWLDALSAALLVRIRNEVGISVG